MSRFDFGTILYGASYYDEYMPHDRLASDVAMMAEAGLTMVRIGDSLWPQLEPVEGQFDPLRIGQVVDAMHGAGIKVVLVTPTYTLPPWLMKAYPEVLADTRSGRAPSYGMRQNMNTDHPAFRRCCERIIRNLVGHFRDHPGVIGWQIDNETASYGAANPSVFLGFVDWLKARYGTVEALNKAWLNAYWGQTLRSWDELAQQDTPQSTGYRLDWTRYQKHRVTDYMAFQAGLVRGTARPDQFILQDFSAGFHTDVDEPAVAAVIDMVGANPYHATQDLYHGHEETLAGDYYRGLKDGTYIVTETNAQSLGWASTLQYPPYDGQARLSVYNNIASGAQAINYWHWHSIHSGQETFWKGILSHDLEPNRFLAEFTTIAQELKRLGPVLANARKSPEVAFLHSGDSQNALAIMPITAGHASNVSPFIPTVPDYEAIFTELHRRFYDLNVETDIITPDVDLSRYKLLVLPAFYVASDAQLQRIADYVAGGGHVLATFKTGFVDETNTVRPIRAPGPLRDVAGFSYQEFSNLRAPIALTGQLAGSTAHWAEFLLLEGAEALAGFDHPFFSRWPAVTTHAFGQGRFTYMGSWLDATGQAALVRQALDFAGLAVPDWLPAPVKLKCAMTPDGQALTFLMNFGSDPVSFAYGLLPGTDLLTGREIGRSDPVRLEPWGVMAIRA